MPSNCYPCRQVCTPLHREMSLRDFAGLYAFRSCDYGQFKVVLRSFWVLRQHCFSKTVIITLIFILIPITAARENCSPGNCQLYVAALTSAFRELFTPHVFTQLVNLEAVTFFNPDLDVKWIESVNRSFLFPASRFFGWVSEWNFWHPASLATLQSDFMSSASGRGTPLIVVID